MMEADINADFWCSDEPVVMVNPRDPVACAEAGKIRPWLSGQPGLSGHVFFRTSGSTGKGKWVALSRAALLASAEGANAFLGIGEDARWLRVLPVFHVGGMGILARARLSGCAVVSAGGKWSAEKCHGLIHREGVTHVSLVPVQLADLVKEGLRAPESLSVALVGGGRLDDRIHARAVELGWPVVETYGMTETASQVATSLPGERNLHVLPGWSVRQDDGVLSVKGAALLTGYVGCAGDGCFLEDPRKGGWFRTSDLGSVIGGYLQVHGRADRCVKIRGELVNLDDVEKGLRAHVRNPPMAGEGFTVMWMGGGTASDREGKLVLATEGDCGFDDELLHGYNAECHPLQRVHKVVRVGDIPRTALGKIDYSTLEEILRTKNNDESD